MSEEHLTDQQLEDFVTGGSEATAIAEHAAICRSCAGRLQREARLEACMFEVASFENRQRRVRAARYVALAAAAAIIAVFAGRHAHRPHSNASLEPVGASDVYACLDDAQLDSCRREARKHGRIVEYPFDADEVPIYEATQEEDRQ